jgi:hypothetical protein
MTTSLSAPLLQVSRTQGYAGLTKRQTDLITAEACAALAHYQKALQVNGDLNNLLVLQPLLDS